MLGKKGFAITKSLLVLVIAGTAGIGLAGFSIGQLQEFLTYIVENWWTIFSLILGIAFAGTIIGNALQDDPDWKEDVMWGGALIAVLLGIAFVPSITGAVETLSAEAEVTVSPWLNEIDEIDVDNFQSSNPFQTVPRQFFIFPDDTATLEYDVYCEGEMRDSGAIQFESGLVLSQTEQTTIFNLPKGDNCEIQTELKDEDENFIDSKTEPFTVIG